VKYLLDTHLLLWSRISPGRLSRDCVNILLDPEADLHFSVVSLWEIAIKFSLRRPDFTIDPQAFRVDLLSNDHSELPIVARHTMAVASLPPIHRDPFDRMLVAQAQTDDLILLTADKTVARYPGPVQLM